MIGPLDVNTVRVRAVQGRTIDPFRGTVDETPQRLVARSADTQPFVDVLALIQGMAVVQVERTGRRIQIKRGDEALKIAFVSAAPRVSLDDVVLEGDGRLALAVMHALLPMFGPVEIRIGRYEDLIDGHEPIVTVIERFDSWFVEDSLRVAKKLRQEAAKAVEGAGGPIPGGAPHSTIGASVVERRARAADKSHFTKVLLLAFAVLVVIVGGGAIWKGLTKTEVGEPCDSNKDCDSDRCLPRRSVSVTVLNGMTLAPSSSADPNNLDGVCTVRCGDDTDCPASMACRELVETHSMLVMASRTWGCVPRAWETEAY